MLRINKLEVANNGYIDRAFAFKFKAVPFLFTFAISISIAGNLCYMFTWYMSLYNDLVLVYSAK